MKNKRYMSLLSLAVCAALVGCAGTNESTYDDDVVYETPTVDYVERLDVTDSSHQDSFLNQLAMNYRSYSIYNARNSGYPDIAELFAHKAIMAFAGETPFPENLDSWSVSDNAERFEIYTAYNKLIDALKDDAGETNPQLAAEAQAKFDCWISAAASGQNSTAAECKNRFNMTLHTLQDCENGKVVAPTHVKSANLTPKPEQEQYYPETRRLNAMAGASRSRDGVVIVNNINIPLDLIQPVPHTIINQNIYGGDEGEDTESATSFDMETEEMAIVKGLPEKTIGEEYVSRAEFINMMMAMRSELAEINKKLSEKEPGSNDKTIIKVQQIPLEPQQRIMEEIFEIRFDFDKAIIKPEYDEIIKQLAATTQANKNVKVSVVGHTDTAGSSSYNYALGGRRAEAVQKMLIEYGIPSSQIVAVSAGEEDLKVLTPNNTPNAENRRVRVVKETEYMEPVKPAPIVVEEYTETDECADCGM